MSPNPATPPAHEPVRHPRSAADEGTALDDLGYECAMPHLWVGEDELPDGPAEGAALGDGP